MSSLLPKYVLFDMDGTLIDNYEFHVKAWGLMCSKYGVPRNRSEIIRDLHGTNFEICQKYFGPEITFEQSEVMSQEKEVLYRELYAPHITPIRGLIPFLDALRQAEVPIGLGTMGTSENAQFVLDALDLHEYFAVLRTAESVTKGKPDPEIFISCLQGLGATEELRKEELWVFEDTTSGIQAAVRTGGTALGILTSCDEKTLLNQGATRVFADYQEVMNLLL